MRLRLTTTLAISADAAAALVATPALLEHVAAPLLRFTPIDPPAFPQVWEERAYRVRVLLFGLLPIGGQWIDISRLAAPEGTFLMRDNGSGHLARRWDHRIIISPEGSNSCTYIDDIDIEGGILTPFVWSFALLFYSHRQRRWRRLATSGGVIARQMMARARWSNRLEEELLAFRAARAEGDVLSQWRALERAHILSQISLLPHLKVHRLMLGVAVRLGDMREIIGQTVRLALAPLGTLSGRIPWGNTGRSRVNAFKPMPIPQDLRDVLPPSVVEQPNH